MDITNITDDMIGKKITCYIKDEYIDDGEITYDTIYESFYILQNKKDGANCRNKKTYKHSWVINYANNLPYSDITKLKLKNPITSSIELWI